MGGDGHASAVLMTNEALDWSPSEGAIRATAHSINRMTGGGRKSPVAAAELETDRCTGKLITESRFVLAGSVAYALDTIRGTARPGGG